MSLAITHSLELYHDGHMVNYVDTTSEEIKPGYVLKMDPTEHDSPQPGEFKESVIGRSFVKPATANLFMPTGVAVVTPQRLKHGSVTDWSAPDLRVIFPQISRIFPVLVAHGISYAAGDILEAADGQWHLVRQAAGPAAPILETSVAKVIKAVDLTAETEPQLILVSGIN